MNKAVVTVFGYGGILGATAECMLGEARNFPEQQWHVFHGDALISRARSKVASMLLHTNDAPDICVMIDHDIAWEIGDVQRIIDVCVELKGVVAGIYPKRGFGGGVPIRPKPGVEMDGGQGDDRLIQMDYVSSGFMAIHRDVLVTLSKDLPLTTASLWPFFMPMITENVKDKTIEYLSEDWSMCRRASLAGFPVVADLKPILTHTGEYTFRGVDIVTDPTAPDGLISYGTIHINHVVLDTLSDDAAEFLELPKDSIMDHGERGRRDLATMWNQKGDMTEMEYYQDEQVGRNYILDQMASHLQNGIGVIFLGALKDIKNVRCLDYGSGIGTAALILNDGKDNTVTVVEPNDVMLDFMGHRLKALKQDTAIHIIHEDRADLGEYDIIVCWHVLEHVEDPRAVIDKLVKALAPGGSIFSDSDFTKDAHHPMHHEDFDARAAWLASGLEYRGDGWYTVSEGS